MKFYVYWRADDEWGRIHAGLEEFASGYLASCYVVELKVLWGDDDLTWKIIHGELNCEGVGFK